MRVMFSLTLISGRSCSLRAAQSELEEAKLGKGKRVCKRVCRGGGERGGGRRGEDCGVCVCVCR